MQIIPHNTSIGTSRAHRMLGALSPHTAPLDGRDLPALLAWAVEVAGEIRFWDDRLEPTGDWGKFLLRDLSFLLAQIVSTPQDTIDHRQQTLVKACEESLTERERAEHVRAYAHFLSEEFLRLHQWHRNLHAINETPDGSAEGFESELEGTIRHKLAGPTNELFKTISELWAGDAALVETAVKIGYLPENTAQARGASPVPTEWEKVLSTLRLSYRQLQLTRAQLVQRGRWYLELSLHKKANHPPHTALLMAFLGLYQKRLASLNQLTARHLDFYYRDILGIQEKDLNPDAVFVCFRLAQQTARYFLPQATILVQENADPDLPSVAFATANDLKASQAVISSIKTLYVGKNALISAGEKYQLILGVHAAPVARSKDGQGKPFEDEQQAAFPLFGEDQFGRPREERNMGEARLGFALADPIFSVREGTRLVSVFLRFAQTSTRTFMRLVRDVSSYNKISSEDAFYKVFTGALRIYLTGDSEWLPVEKYEVVLVENEGEQEILLQFELNQDFPAVGAYQVEMGGLPNDVSLPVMRVELAPDAPVYVYSFLKDLSLEQFRVSVEVTGVRGLQVFNELGQQDMGMPFPLFGPQPILGSYVLLGCPEIFQKNISSLSITLNWHNLPDLAGGIAAYYSAYQNDLDNNSFVVSLSALQHRQFGPESSLRPRFSLFDATEDGRLKPFSRFQLADAEPLGLEANPNFVMPEMYQPTVRAGYLRLELISPQGGFAHEAYPDALSRAALAQATPPRPRWYLGDTSVSAPPETPRAPLSPMVKGISLSYKATASFDTSPVAQALKQTFNAQQPQRFFHLHPFGFVETFSKGKAIDTKLLPQYQDAANLFLGLSDFAAPGRISMLFHMRSDQVLTHHQQLHVRWSYLAGNRWIPFSEDQILQDSTAGFTATGIVELDIPREIDTNNTLLPKGQHWLCASLGRSPESPVYLQQIYENAVRAVRQVSEENLREAYAPLPAGSTMELETYLPEIDGIIQPVASGGGRPPEQGDEYYLRVSERLRHKGRAINAWDYEHLVLEAFPEIYQVKCLTYHDYPALLEPSCVKVVVVPRFDNPGGKYLEPRANFALLDRVRAYLQKRTSPFAQVEVCNPEYEKLKISCGIVFQEGKNDGSYLEKLNQDIKRYICPWMFGETNEMDLGGDLHKNNLLGHITKLPYVKFATRFSIVQVISDDGYYSVQDTARDQTDTPRITASRPWSVLVALDKHPISFLDREVYQYPEPAGIDTMIVETDFVIKKEASEQDIFAPKSKAQPPSDDLLLLKITL